MDNIKDFIGYEYKDITVKSDSASLYADSFASFGWTLDATSNNVGGGSVTLKFKRDRKIHNKAELTRLQRQFEAQAAEIERLERSKEIAASSAAYGVGLVGTAFMAGSVFAVTAAVPKIALCVILAIPGFVGWAVPYLLHGRLRRSKTEAVTPLIENKYDEIYGVCEKASLLLG